VRVHALIYECVDFGHSQTTIEQMTEAQMFGNRKIKNQQPSPYANRRDFCRIFENDMNRLYLLSFLLTGDRALAEQCFVGGLHIAQEGNQVFKDWAESWARRAIILNAIRIIRPRTTSGNTAAAPDSSAAQTEAEPAETAEIVGLPAFERFVFVMSALEHYSDQECSLLLGCTRGDVTAARSRGLHQIGTAAVAHDNVISIGSAEQRMPAHLESKLHPEIVSGLAASA
jgi:DNA-directed RNA polymerase specialized sigma24 family protein